MTKNPNLDDLNEEELIEYLNKGAEEDQKADSSSEEVLDENKENSEVETIEVDAQEESLDEEKEDEQEETLEKEESSDRLIHIPYDQEKAKISEEILVQSEKELKKAEKAEKKEKKKLRRELEKKIKAHRKYLKKNPSTLVRYETDPENGLPNEVVEQRILDELVNRNDGKKSKSIGRIIFTNVVTFFNILIFIIAGLLISVGAITDLTFLLIVTINIVIGIVQEIRAKKIIDELTLMSAPTVIVKRGGVEKEVATDEIVLDDLIILKAGDQICSDSIVIEGQVEVNESLLTGESDAIVKKVGDVLYSGSYIVSGEVSARVDKIGKDNYIEHLSGQAKVYKKPKSDLLVSLNMIIKIMSLPVVVIGISLFLIMFLKNGVDYTTSIRRTAGAMIGMIPSGLFLMSSIALGVGVIRLGKKNVLVQELYCIEMLARVNCICLDKTGTITDGTMVVKNVIDYNTISGLATRNIVSAILNALHDQNLTSQALEAKFGLGKSMKFTAKIPFSSQRKYQAVTFDKYGTFILGAPEFVLNDEYKKVSKDVEKYAKIGFRVLCLAHREGTIYNEQLPDATPTVVSMILIEDNIRPDAIDTIKYFKESGVSVRVISGDNPITVSKISERAGIENADKYISLDGMSDEDVVKAALRYTVFGRVSPNQKKLIIQTLKSAGKTVAMTGDGVNDILALREADCSIALASGSDASRNCSHLVLLDNNFGSMPQVVAEGRRVINNVTSVASLFLTKTIFSLFLAIQALINGTYPISAIQLIIIDTMAIGLPSLILVNEPNNNPVQGRFMHNVVKKALPGAIVILIISMIVFLLSGELNLDSLSLSTIIVISATHTCLVVLYDACKPFTAIHKWLYMVCYGVFIFAIMILPQLLEFKPIFKFSEYYSSSITTEYVNQYPSVEISKSNYYVVDGVVSTLQTNNNYQTITLTRYDDSTDSGNDAMYYAINGEMIDSAINIPSISYDKYGRVYLGGYLINSSEAFNGNYYNGIESSIVTDNKGKLSIKVGESVVPLYTTLTKSNSYYNFEIKYGNYSATDAIRQYSILPTVELKDGEYIIDGIMPTDGKYKAETSVINSNKSLDVAINPETLELLINGKTIYKTYTDGSYDQNDTYKVSIPSISTSGNTHNEVSRMNVYFDAVDTSVTIFELYGLKQDTVIQDVKNPNYTIYKALPDGGKEFYKYYKQSKTVYRYNRVLDKDDNDITDDFEKHALLDNKYIYNDGSTDYVYTADQFNQNAYIDLVFDGFDEADFSAYYGVNGTIDVNNSTNSLSVNVLKGESFYRLSQSQGGSVIVNNVATKATLDNSQFAPSIEVTQAGYYIIDGYYTSYTYNGNELNPHKSSNSNNLVLGGTITDYTISPNNVISTKGGIVTELSTTYKIFLLMLCLLSAPMMKILQNVVPWVRKQAYSIQEFISKF